MSTGRSPMYRLCNPVAGVARDYVPTLMQQIALLANQALPRVSATPAILLPPPHGTQSKSQEQPRPPAAPRKCIVQ